jgi:hypothetical protein
LYTECGFAFGKENKDGDGYDRSVGGLFCFVLKSRYALMQTHKYRIFLGKVGLLHISVESLDAREVYYTYDSYVTSCHDV